MCASVYPSLLLFLLSTTLTISIMCGPQMATGGLPLGRRERGADQDILAGADFLSILIESSLRRAYSETTTPATLLDLEDDALQDVSMSYVRTPRETSPLAQTSTEIQSDTTLVSDSDTSDGSDSDGVVVGVSVSSSVGRTVNRDQQPARELVKFTSTLSDTLTEPPTTELDQNFVASEEHPTLVAKASKSELAVEESEPITRDSHLDFAQGYPARVRELPNPFQTDASYPSQNNQKPIHSTLIFHDTPQDSGSARSVSYSTVIQHPHLQSEMERNSPQHERRERNYNGAQSIFVNNYDFTGGEKRKYNETKTPPQQGYVQENDMTVVTSTPFSSTRKNWEENDDAAKIDVVTTERNWEMQEKPYSPPPVTARQMPKVYGRPEQNYEVDEAVSVVTNGRAHGLQPSLPPDKVDQRNSTKKDDNQKVGYVVEGRNYRKYRVEERTADGFIVGEYGVVSHDDGSLRGVRYTADGTINPRLIYDALMKFLAL